MLEPEISSTSPNFYLPIIIVCYFEGLVFFPFFFVYWERTSYLIGIIYRFHRRPRPLCHFITVCNETIPMPGTKN